MHLLLDKAGTSHTMTGISKHNADSSYEFNRFWLIDCSEGGFGITPDESSILMLDGRNDETNIVFIDTTNGDLTKTVTISEVKVLEAPCE